MAGSYYLTYTDAVDRLVDYLGGAPDDREQRMVRAAIVDAYREVAQDPRSWRYFIRKHRLNLEGYYSTGTITYTSSSRALTLASGTWPSWAGTAEVRIASVVYEVESRDSDTVLTLHEDNCPTANIAALTEYVLYKSSYALPFNFLSLFQPHGAESYYKFYVEPQNWHYLEFRVSQGSEPILWTIMGDRKKNMVGRLALFVYPYPSEDTSLDFLMRIGPHPIRVTGHEANSYVGTMAVTAAGTTVTGTGTNFTTLQHAGKLLRIGDSATEAPSGQGGLTPFVEEHIISSVASTTSLTLATPATYTSSGVKYRIADPLYLERTMYEAMMRRCEMQLAVTLHEKPDRVALLRELYVTELVRAMENDLRMDPGPDSGPLGQNLPSGDDWYHGVDYTVSL